MVENGAAEYRFVCDECGESLEVNDAMRDTLIEKGCVICSATVTTTEFSTE
jgi:predicted nucleic acid-binding Zn ribbon protein